VKPAYSLRETNQGKHKEEHSWSDSTQDPDYAIEELNHRFLEHWIGYQYSDSAGLLVRLGGVEAARNGRRGE
jgi:hypothetical protein